MFSSFGFSRILHSLSLSLRSALLCSRLCSSRASLSSLLLSCLVSASPLLVPRLSSLPGSTPLIKSKRDSASAIAFSQPRTYSICIEYSISVASHAEILTDALGSFGKATGVRGDRFSSGTGVLAGKL